MSAIKGIACLIMLGWATGMFAQPCTVMLRGEVLDRATREPLGYTTVGITELSTGMLADSNGRFEFMQLCPGDYHLQVHHLGCDPATLFIKLRRDTAITIWLDHHAEMLREVRVEGASAAYQAAQFQQSVTESQLRQDAGRPLAEIIARVAGVRALKTGSGISKPVIHGLTGNRVAVINNGVFQAGQQWGSDHAPEIDPNAARLIRVIKGSDAIAYGSRAIGGAVIVEAGPIPDDPHIHGAAGYILETNGWVNTLYGRLQQGRGPYAWRFTGTVKRGGDTRAPDYFLTNTGVAEANASAQVQYRPSSRMHHDLYYSLFSTRLGIFTGSHISNLTDLEEALGRDVPFGVKDEFSYSIAPPKQHVVHHLLRYAGKRFASADNFWEWSYAVQRNHRQEFDIRRGDRSDIPALDLSLWAQTVDAQYVHGEGRFPYRLGVQGTYSDNSNSYETGILPLIPDYRELVAGVFGTVHHHIGQLTLEGGARYDYQYFKVWAISTTLPREVNVITHTYDDLAFSVGGAITYGAAETRLHQALVVRSPEVNELYSNGLHQGVAGIEEGEPSLRPETGLKTTLTQSVDFANVVHLEVGLFAHLFYDYIYLEPQDELRLTIRGAFPVYRYRQQDALLHGIDVVGIVDLGEHWTWTSKFSAMRGASLQAGDPLPMMPPLQWVNGIAWSLPDGDRRKGTKVQVDGEYTARQDFWDPEAELVPPPDG